MDHYIKKIILIDDLLDLNISHIKDMTNIEEILDILNILRETKDIDIDIEFFNRILYIVDENIFEADKYVKSLVNLGNVCGDDDYMRTITGVDSEYNYINDCLNEYYLYKHKIQSFINEMNMDDHLIDLMTDMNII